MPHVIVKMVTGRSEAQKQRLVEEVAQAVMTSLGVPESSISVAIEDYAAGEWTKAVYEPDILARPGTIFKKPGYEPS